MQLLPGTRRNWNYQHHVNRRRLQLAMIAILGVQIVVSWNAVKTFTILKMTQRSLFSVG